MSRDTRYPVIADTFLFLRPQDHPAGRAGRDRAIGFLRLAKAANLRDRRGAIVFRDTVVIRKDNVTNGVRNESVAPTMPHRRENTPSSVSRPIVISTVPRPSEKP